MATMEFIAGIPRCGSKRTHILLPNPNQKYMVAKSSPQGGQLARAHVCYELAICEITELQKVATVEAHRRSAKRGQ